MAIRAVLGDDLVSYITYLDSLGAAVEGATFTTMAGQKGNGDSFDVTVEELGGGAYRMYYTTTLDDPTGEWYIAVRGSVEDAVFDETWDVTGATPIDTSGTITLRSHFTYLAPDLSPVLGATFTTVNSARPDGTAFTVSVTEIGSGVYRMDAVTDLLDPSGEWYAAVRGDYDDSVFEHTWDIGADTGGVTFPQKYLGIGTSRADIRRMVADELGDLISVRATANGNEAMVIDTQALILEVNHYNGMEILCRTGHTDNVGRVATITTSNQAASSVGFMPPFPRPTKATDTFELYNKRGVGWRVSEYNRAINAAIRRAGQDHATIPYNYDVTDTFDYRDPVIAIPDDMAYFSGVTMVNARGVRKKLPPKHFEVDRGDFTVRVHPRWATAHRGASVVLHGHMYPPLLEADDHKTPIQLEWLVHEVKAILTGADTATGSTQGARDRLFFLERQAADGRRTSIIGRYGPNTVRLR